jgi:hypothetical protein
MIVILFFGKKDIPYRNAQKMLSGNAGNCRKTGQFLKVIVIAINFFSIEVNA